jgi:hypothetical protein
MMWLAVSEGFIAVLAFLAIIVVCIRIAPSDRRIPLRPSQMDAAPDPSPAAAVYEAAGTARGPGRGTFALTWTGIDLS